MHLKQIVNYTVMAAISYAILYPTLNIIGLTLAYKVGNYLGVL